MPSTIRDVLKLSLGLPARQAALQAAAMKHPDDIRRRRSSPRPPKFRLEDFSDDEPESKPRRPAT